jgi:hypothetical protein
MWGIDLVAGPLLTLIVYKVDKPSLRFDLTVIALLQLAFLGYGLHTLWGSRPVFLVGLPTRMSLVFANEIEEGGLAKAPSPAWRHLSWQGPVLVGAVPPKSDEERQDLLFATMASGVDLDRMPERYVEYAQVAPSLLATALPVDVAIARKKGVVRRVKKVPLITARGEGEMWLDASTGVPISTSTVSEQHGRSN